MILSLLVLLGASLLLTSVATAAMPRLVAPVLKRPDTISGEYFVWFKHDLVSRAEVSSVAADLVLRSGGQIIRETGRGARGFGVRVSEAGLHILLLDPRVRQVEENARIHISGGSQGPLNSELWHLDRIDQVEPITSISPKFYEWESDGTGVDVYVVDSGIRSSHEEFFSGQVTSGVDFNGDDGWAPTNPCNGGNFINGGHGTAVASLIGGQELGVAKGATLIPVKFIACGGGYPNGIQASFMGAIWSMNWIMEQVELRERRAVINISWWLSEATTCTIPYPFCSIDCEINCASALEYNISELMNDYNVVVVASSNNQNVNTMCDDSTTSAMQSPMRMGYGGMYDVDPVNNPTRRLVITVGGTDIDDEKYVCCSTLGSNGGPCVGIYAPAHLIKTAYLTSNTAYRNQNEPLESSGTSFSAAIVSGVVARILEAYPTKDVREVWDFLKSEATDLGQDFDGDSVDEDLVYISPDV
jgi:subtilisin family serine protease